MKFGIPRQRICTLRNPITPEICPMARWERSRNRPTSLWKSSWIRNEDCRLVCIERLSAGFEIENPRLTEPRDMPWAKNAATPDYFDIRDDRIHFFTTATGKEQTLYDQVRVISKGTFTVWGEGGGRVGMMVLVALKTLGDAIAADGRPNCKSRWAGMQPRLQIGVSGLGKYSLILARRGVSIHW